MTLILSCPDDVEARQRLTPEASTAKCRGFWRFPGIRKRDYGLPGLTHDYLWNPAEGTGRNGR
jgi:hypothetical protein